jgi:DNA-binding transcriptional regulator YbjK
VLERLHEESKRRDASFRDTLNMVVREGLVAVEQRRENRKAVVVIPRSLGLKPDFHFDSISALLSLAEGEDHR